MKKFYMLMITVFTILIGATGCGESAPEYGVPTDENQVQDEDTVINDDQIVDAEYGAPLTDYDTAADADTEITDDPAMEYGPIQTDYDAADSDTEVSDDVAQPEYGVTPTDYDASADSDVETPDENPDEMTTDYGPISTKFHK